MAVNGAELHGPIIRGELDVVRDLIGRGAPLNEPMGVFRSLPLEYAIDHGQTQIAKFLIDKGANLNDNRTQFHQGPLHLAANKGRVEIVRALLKAGADVGLLDKNGWTPLDAAASYSGGKAGLMVAEIIKCGGDVNRGSNTWGTPLIKACWQGHISAVQELLRHGADANVMSANGTPLFVAISNKRADAIIVLRLAGADPNLRYTYPEQTNGNKDHRHKTPLQFANEIKQKKLVELLEVPLNALESLAAPPKVTEEDVPGLWKRIEKYARKVDPGIKKVLNKGASAHDIAAIEQASGIQLVGDFRASWAIHDGQLGGELIPEDWFDQPYELLPAESIITEWKTWKSLIDTGEFRNDESTPDDGIRADWYHPAWIPIASNGGGDFLCLDFAPVAKGRVGQVIEMRHDSPTRRLVAGSFVEFLRELAERWESRSAE